MKHARKWRLKTRSRMTRGLVRKDRMREIPPLKTHTRRTSYHLLHRDSLRLLGEFDEMGPI